MQTKETFGEVIRRLREEKNLPIRKVAASLDIDPSTLSKIERNDRSANKRIVKRLAQLFRVSEKELLIGFLSDKVTYELLDEECSNDILRVAEEKIKYIRSMNVQQGDLQL